MLGSVHLVHETIFCWQHSLNFFRPSSTPKPSTLHALAVSITMQFANPSDITLLLSQPYSLLQFLPMQSTCLTKKHGNMPNLEIEIFFNGSSLHLLFYNFTVTSCTHNKNKKNIHYNTSPSYPKTHVFLFNVLHNMKYVLEHVEDA